MLEELKKMKLDYFIKYAIMKLEKLKKEKSLPVEWKVRVNSTPEELKHGIVRVSIMKPAEPVEVELFFDEMSTI